MLVCLVVFSNAQRTNYSQRELNIFAYQSSSDYEKYFIPLYGKYDSKLTIKIYSASQYMGEWMKATEYPISEYYVTYNNDGLLSTVETSEVIKYYQYKYDNKSGSVLNRVDAYSKTTGEKVASREYRNVTKYFYNSYDYNAFIQKIDSYWCSVVSIEGITTNNGWATGWTADIYAHGYNENDASFLCVYGSNLYNSSSTMIKEYGLSWKSQVRDKSTGPMAGSVLWNNSWARQKVLRDGVICNRAGLPIEKGMKNVDVWELNYFVRYEKWYEYEWH